MQDLPTKADDMFCFATYSAAHVINRAYAALLKPLGLTYPQYITLTLLWELDGQSVGELSKHLRMDSSTLTPLLKRLEKLGHVVRRRGTADERQVFIHLTQTGKSLKKQAPEITACMISSTGLELEELRTLIAKLNTLSNNLTAES